MATEYTRRDLLRRGGGVVTTGAIVSLAGCNMPWSDYKYNSTVYTSENDNGREKARVRLWVENTTDFPETFTADVTINFDTISKNERKMLRADGNDTAYATIETTYLGQFKGYNVDWEKR